MINPRKTFSNIGEDEDLLMESISGSRWKDRKKSQPIPNPTVDMMKEATSVLKNLSQRTNSLGDSAVPSTVTSQSKSLDDFFGETIGKLMQEIPGGMNKDMLKLEIQNLICIFLIFRTTLQKESFFCQCLPFLYLVVRSIDLYGSLA